MVSRNNENPFDLIEIHILLSSRWYGTPIDINVDHTFTGLEFYNDWPKNMFNFFMKDRIYAFINLQPLPHCATR